LHEGSLQNWKRNLEVSDTTGDAISTDDDNQKKFT